MKNKVKNRKAICGSMLVILIAAFVLSGTDVPGAVSADARMSDTAFAATIECGNIYGICQELLQALIETESSGNPRAVNGGCKGLCQIYEKYHYERMKKLNVWDIYDERSNILIAADYLAELIEKYEDVCLVLDIYNGNSNAKRNYEQGIISEYAGKILKRATELERLHGK